MQLRMTPWFQLASLLALAFALAACSSNPGGGIVRPTQVQEATQDQTNTDSLADESEATRVEVIARDFEFIIDTETANAGAVTFEVLNEGSMPHDFAIIVAGEQYKTPMINPGESASFTVEMEPGTYDYICTIPGHDILGMKGQFTVR